jgi:hypothetical protein
VGHRIFLPPHWASGQQHRRKSRVNFRSN